MGHRVITSQRRCPGVVNGCYRALCTVITSGTDLGTYYTNTVCPNRGCMPGLVYWTQLSAQTGDTTTCGRVQTFLTETLNPPTTLMNNADSPQILWVLFEGIAGEQLP